MTRYLEIIIRKKSCESFLYVDLVAVKMIGFPSLDNAVDKNNSLDIFLSSLKKSEQIFENLNIFFYRINIYKFIK